MSKDDPTDDELEAEARRDVPLGSGGSNMHAPKLSNVDRRIDLRAERESLNADRDARTRTEVPLSNASRPTHYVDMPETSAGRLELAMELLGIKGAPPEHTRVGARRSPLAAPEDIPPPRANTPAPTPFHPDAAAWDRFAAAALMLLAGKSATPETDAALIADTLLEERRRRFG